VKRRVAGVRVAAQVLADQRFAVKLVHFGSVPWPVTWAHFVILRPYGPADGGACRPPGFGACGSGT
jgi:hypothetical protein